MHNCGQNHSEFDHTESVYLSLEIIWPNLHKIFILRFEILRFVFIFLKKNI